MNPRRGIADDFPAQFEGLLQVPASLQDTGLPFSGGGQLSHFEQEQLFGQLPRSVLFEELFRGEFRDGRPDICDLAVNEHVASEQGTFS